MSMPLTIPCVRACVPNIYKLDLLLTWGLYARTAIAVTMHVVLGFLYVVDHVCHSLYIFDLIRCYLLDPLVLPLNVLPVGHSLLIF